MSPYKCKMDFEVGHLVKSPCKECEEREVSFPHCVRVCRLLNRVQEILAETRSMFRG